MRIAALALTCWASTVTVLMTSTAAYVAIAGVLLGVVGGSFAFATGNRGRTALVAVAGMIAGLISLSVLANAPARHPDALTKPASQGRSMDIEVRYTGLPQRRDGGDGYHTRVVIQRLDEHAVRVPAMLFTDGESPPVLGSSATMRADAIANGPAERASALVFAETPPHIVEPAPWYLSWASELRHGFVTLCAEMPGSGAQLLPGLAVGDVSSVDPDLEDQMKTTSLSHLTAVSGANCALIIVATMLVTGWLGLPRTARVMLSLTMLLGFVTLVTPEASVVRAAVMASIVLVVQLTGRPAGGLPVLGLCVIGILMIDPWMGMDAGFALSVLATAGLLLLARPLSRALGRVLPVPLAAGIALPLSAQLACQPVLILLSGTLSPYGVAANILADPAAPFATVLGLLACLLSPLLPPLAQWVAWLGWIPSSWIAAVATRISRLPFAELEWVGGLVGAVLLSAVTALGLWLLLSARFRRGIWGRAATLLLCCAVGIYSGVAVVPPLVTRTSRPADWRIAMCDVGQGDATLLRAGGAIMLVDTGPDPAPLESCLNSLHVDRIDLLVLTHYDLDHIGGLEAVASATRRALVQTPSEAAGVRTLSTLRHAGAETITVSDGSQGSIGGIDYSVLWPKDDRSTGNAGSVVVSADVVDTSILLLGDLGEQQQDELLLQHPSIGPYDVVKVAHHGSKDQAALLYEQAGAAVGLIGVGADNDYGHPTRRILDILSRVGTAVYRTDQDGAILITEDSDGLAVWVSRVRDRQGR